MTRQRVNLEVRTIRVTFNAALAQARRLPPDERARAVSLLVGRSRELLKGVRGRVAANGGAPEALATIDRAVAEVTRAA